MQWAWIPAEAGNDGSEAGSAAVGATLVVARVPLRSGGGIHGSQRLTPHSPRYRPARRQRNGAADNRYDRLGAAQVDLLVQRPRGDKDEVAGASIKTLRPVQARVSLSSLVERHVSGHQDGASLVALAKDLEEKFRGGAGKGHEAQFVNDQQVETGQLVCQGRERRARGTEPASATNASWMPNTASITSFPEPPSSSLVVSLPRLFGARLTCGRCPGPQLSSARITSSYPSPVCTALEPIL